MVKIKCIKDKFGSLIPIDKIEYISKGCWVSAGGSRRDISYNTLVLLLDIFEEIEKEEPNDDWKYSIAEKLGISREEYDKIDHNKDYGTI